MSPYAHPERLPWMPFFASDWLLDERVRSLDWAQRGVYFDMLCWQWREGSLPNNVEQIRQMLGNNAAPTYIASILATFFTAIPENRVINKRLADVRDEQVRIIAAQRAGGKSGRRKQLRAHPGVTPGQPREIQNQIQNESQKQETPAPGGARATWLTPYGEAWFSAYGGQPPYRQLANQLRPLLEKHTPEAVLTAWKGYLSETDARFASGSRFAATFGKWAVRPPVEQQCAYHPDRKAYGVKDHRGLCAACWEAA